MPSPFVAALVVSEGFKGPHCSRTAMADLLVQESRVVTDYWGNDFEARRLTVRGRRGRFLGIRRPKALLYGYGRSAGAGVGTQLLGGRTKRRPKLSTLAQGAMLSTPDQLDRLSRRADAARHGGGPARQKASRGSWSAEDSGDGLKTKARGHKNKPTAPLPGGTVYE